MQKSDLNRVNKYLWEIPKSYRKKMKVPVRIYASEKLLKNIFEDKSLPQLVNVASLPGIVKHALGMPDVHQGYGAPIGGVGATKFPDGLISPGFIGFDENCGVRLLKTSYSAEEINKQVENLATEMQRRVPSGVGTGRDLKFNRNELDKILRRGVERLVEKGYAREEDVENCESSGRMKQADPSAVSDEAKGRGEDQLGTLGSGNHFLEIQEVDQIFNEEVAQEFKLSEGQAVVMIHTGSRGFGHQVCTDYLDTIKKAVGKYNINLPDKNLAGIPLNTSEGKRFFKAMSCSANYAWSNRQMITHFVRKAWKSVLGKENLKLLYDVAHNIAKVEEHVVNGDKQKLIVHRKGATRAFPPSHPELPEHYKEVGQPVLVPGSMGTSSYVCVGTEQSKETFHSVNHGAGRVMSRNAAVDQFPGQKVVKDLEDRGITVKFKDYKGIAEEASGAYKNVNEVVKVVNKAGLSKKVARLKPLAVIKGE
ncbi:MAG: RtcB family protein [Candidatus Paceibacterota bacterium]